MPAPFPVIFSSFGRWPLEDPLILCPHDQQNNVDVKTRETSSDDHQQEVEKRELRDHHHIEYPNDDDGKKIKKLYHSNIERDRRRRVNDLYSSLRSLLPATDDQLAKLSIPGTVSRVVKYIPELKKEVQRLLQKKEALTIRRCRQEGQAYNYFGKPRKAEVQSKSLFVSASQLGDREIGVQISFLESIKASSLDEALQMLEEEGFLLLNMSCFASCEGTMFCTLHLQAMHGTEAMDVERLREKLMSFYVNREMRC